MSLTSSYLKQIIVLVLRLTSVYLKQIIVPILRLTSVYLKQTLVLLLCLTSLYLKQIIVLVLRLTSVYLKQIIVLILCLTSSKSLSTDLDGMAVLVPCESSSWNSISSSLNFLIFSCNSLKNAITNFSVNS